MRRASCDGSVELQPSRRASALSSEAKCELRWLGTAIEYSSAPSAALGATRSGAAAAGLAASAGLASDADAAAFHSCAYLPPGRASSSACVPLS